MRESSFKIFLIVLVTKFWMAPAFQSSSKTLTVLTQPIQRVKRIPHYNRHSVKVASPFLNQFSSNLSDTQGGVLNSAKSALDMSREMVRIEGLAVYGVVAALFISASIGLYGETSSALETSKTMLEKLLATAAAVLNMTCIVCGTYTTIIFSLLEIYAKTALGAQKDQGYIAFMAATYVYRQTGFRCFIASIYSFLGSFLLSVSFKMKAKVKGVVSTISVVMMLLLFKHTNSVMDLASKLIFSTL